MQKIRTLAAGCLLGLLSLSATTTAMAQENTTTLEITWQDLTPEIDADVFQRYQNRTISPGELREYIHNFNRTPNQDLHEQNIALTGYLLPQDLTEDGRSTQFALVRHVGSWTHTEDLPPPNQIVSVHFPQGMSIHKSTMVRFQVSGKMSVDEYEMPVSPTFFHIEATDISANHRRFNEQY